VGISALEKSVRFIFELTLCIGETGKALETGIIEYKRVTKLGEISK
jgi:hypothetical protein